MVNIGRKVIDLTGQKFGRLTVIKRFEENKFGKPQWVCKCDCNNSYEIIVSGKSLKAGVTKSCGCLQKEMSSKTHKKYNTYDLTGEYGIGYTSKEEEFYFDLEDYDKIKDYYWYIDTSDNYVKTSIHDSNNNNKTYNLKLHRLIMNCPNELVVDHIHGSKTKNDCRKSNLRICTQHENAMNCGISKRNTSGVTGVTWSKKRNKWCVSIGYNKETIYLGCYTSFEKAVNVRKEAEEKYFGEFGYNNSQKEVI